MRDLLNRFFGKLASEDGKASGADTEHDVRVAACALFLEMAKIDETFTEDELRKIIDILEEKYGLSRENIDALIEAAEEQLEGSIDYWQFTNRINRNYSTGEKIEIIEMLWRIVFVDGKMDKYENHLMHVMGNLLRLTHRQLIDAKKKVLHST